MCCAQAGGITALHRGLSGWISLRRRKRDGIVCEFGSQLLQLPRDGTAAAGGQLLRKCVLGKKGINCVQTCLEVPAPRKSPSTAGSCSLLNKADFFLLFIHLNLVELDGSVGCCVEMGCLGSTC